MEDALCREDDPMAARGHDHHFAPRDGGISPRTGFTLIELLVVIAVIMILASGFVAGFISLQNKAVRKRTAAEVMSLATAWTMYENDLRDEPDNLARLGKVFRSNGDLYYELRAGQVSSNIYVMDPYGVAYEFDADGKLYGNGPSIGPVAIWSKGPDGVDSTVAEQKDDITN